jgi:hypothetical protein
MPWQSNWFDIVGEYYIDDDTGLTVPYYDEAFFTTPRQSGKTTILVSWVWDRGLLWGGPQLIGWTSQTGKDGRDKWLSEINPRIESSELEPLVLSLHKGMGNEAWNMTNGSMCRLLGTSATAGHGGTYDAAVLDEIFADRDWRRDQMFIPAMATKRDGQRLVCSTAGDGGSVVYNAKKRQGRRAVEEDTGSGLAYLEYSAPVGWDEGDEDSWWEFMPALGHTISVENVRSARRSLEEKPGEFARAEKPGEFARAYGNIPNSGLGDQVIPSELWVQVVHRALELDGKYFLAFDVAADRSCASIAIADDSARVELVDARPGTGWLTDRVNELCERWDTDAAFDQKGPAGAFERDIDRPGGLPSLEVVQACGAFYDAVADHRVQVRHALELDDGLEGAVKKPVGDNWVWSRKSSTNDVTPLYAVTMAAWVSRKTVEAEKKPMAMVSFR